MAIDLIDHHITASIDNVLAYASHLFDEHKHDWAPQQIALANKVS